MFNLFVTISGLVIIINIIYSIIPSEKYSNYSKIIIGLITMLSVINIFSDTSNWSYNSDYEQTHYPNNEYNYTFDIMLKDELEEKINQFLTEKFGEILKDINVKLENNSIKEIVITIDSSEHVDEIINNVATYCDIKREKVVIQYL